MEPNKNEMIIVHLNHRQVHKDLILTSKVKDIEYIPELKEFGFGWHIKYVDAEGKRVNVNPSDKELLVLTKYEELGVKQKEMHANDNGNYHLLRFSNGKHTFFKIVSSDGQERRDCRNDEIFIDYKTSMAEINFDHIFDYLFYINLDMETVRFEKKYWEWKGSPAERIVLPRLIKALKALDVKDAAVMAQYPVHKIIDVKSIEDQTGHRYARKKGTHVDFLVYNHITKPPIFTIEVDGATTHKREERISKDKLKDEILGEYGLRPLRIRTDMKITEEDFVRIIAKHLKNHRYDGTRKDDVLELDESIRESYVVGDE